MKKFIFCAEQSVIFKKKNAHDKKYDGVISNFH